MGKKHFCFFQTAETGNRTPSSGVKGSGAKHYPRAPARTNTKGRTNQYDLMRISLRNDTTQYDSNRMQLGPVRTDTTWNGPVRTDTTWNGLSPVRFNRDELLATICHAHPCLIVFYAHQINIIFTQFWCCVVLYSKLYYYYSKLMLSNLLNYNFVITFLKDRIYIRIGAQI